ncbi:MAG: galactose-1-phosphate uridylyltransferase [Desulfobacterales bacterium]|nr:MAG: galactose-1-phosphate uridylyltransferase [Desulfobacterales bacterium]
MPTAERSVLNFERQTISAKFIDPAGQTAEKFIEIRTHPITGRTCRIAFSRINEKEAGTDSLPQPPPDAADTSQCPFCRPRVTSSTPQIHPDLADDGRMVQGESLLFPNLFPYGSYSAVSLFNDEHFVEIGMASVSSYTDSFINSAGYLKKVLDHDPQAVYTAVTQNHLPSAGGSLVHPHLQINADRIAANHHRFLLQKADEFHRQNGKFLFSRYLEHEKTEGSRYIGKTGRWEWMAAFAPEGFFEIWCILPGITSFQAVAAADWQDLARGVISIQRFYRSLCRNGYNLGVLAVETPASHLELRAVMVVRSNYATWVRSDYTGYEVMLGDMATFVAPEQTAAWARPFFGAKG